MRLRRRTLLGAAGAAAAGPLRAEGMAASETDLRAPPLGEFRREDFGFVGVFDGDWLTEARYARMLDAMAASSGAFAGVRYFGALNAGTRERDFPTAPGLTWTDPARAPDFAASLAGLDALVSRGLVPFVALTFFPPAVSPASPIAPPADLSRWQGLLRAWLAACASRFGAEEVSRWWLEVWNEPNMPQFWAGGFEDYLRLYRATAEAARGSGLRLRLGGPALAWLPAPDVPGLMERFLRFLAENPDLPCDFLSYHRKGIWDEATETEPEIARLVEAAEAVAEMALRIVPGRCARGLAIVNNEADMKVGFQRPYRPRLTERFPSWLAACAASHAALTARHAGRGLRFLAAADNANQHLVQEPFDGRRALFSPASAARPDRLVKLPVFHFYEMLRLCGPRLLLAEEGRDGLFALATAGEDRAAALVTRHAEGGGGEWEWRLSGLPWPRSDVLVFRVDGALSNAFAAAGGAMPSPPLPPRELRRLRAAAELAEGAPARRGLDSSGGRLALRISLGPFATALALVVPSSAAPAPRPDRVEAVPLPGGDVLLRWRPGPGPEPLGYEVRRLRPGRPLLSPAPLLGRLWVDTAPPRGEELAYAVRAIPFSGPPSPPVASRPIQR